MDGLQIGLLLGGGTVLGLVGFLYWATSRADKRFVEQAIESIRSGATTQDTVARLIRDGLDARHADAVVQAALREWIERSMIAKAAEMLNAGSSESEAIAQLNAQGVEVDAAASIVSDIVRVPWCKRHPIVSVLLGAPILIVGAGLLFASLVLRDGNLTGKFVTFPFAGLVTKLIGVLVTVTGLFLVTFPFRKPSYLFGQHGNDVA